MHELVIAEVEKRAAAGKLGESSSNMAWKLSSLCNRAPELAAQPPSRSRHGLPFVQQ